MLTLRHFLGQPTITLEQRNVFLGFIQAGREKLLAIPATLPDLGTDAAEFQAILARVDGTQAAIDDIKIKLAPEGEEPAAFEEYPALTPDESTVLTQWGADIDRMAAIIAAHAPVSPVAIGKLTTGDAVVLGVVVAAGIAVVTLS